MHRLLERQLRRQLGKEFQPDDALKSFLNIVDSYYHEVDKEQRLLQNALSMNTAELNAVNERMRVQNTEMTRTLLNTLSDGVYATDLEGRLTFMNAAAEKLLGWQEQELIGRAVHEQVPCLQPDGRPFAAKKIPHLTVIADAAAVQDSGFFTGRDGRLIPVDFRSSPIIQNGKITGALVSFQDTSLHIEAANKLHLANERLSAAFKELEFQQLALDEHAIVSIADKTGRIAYVNRKFSEISQYSRDELIGQDHRILNSGFHPREFFQEMWKTIAAGQVWHGEVKNRRRDGSFYWVESTIVPFMDGMGRPERYISVRTDITSRKELEEQLSAQRAFYERISETMGEGLYVQDARGCCTYLNSEGENLLGWTREELFGRPVHDAIHTRTAQGSHLPAEHCPILLAVKEKALGAFRVKVSVRSAIITVVLAFAAGIAGMWLGHQLLAAPPQDGSLHAMVHDELSLTAEQEKALHTLEADFAARRQAHGGRDAREANAELAAAIQTSETAGPAVEAAVHHFHDAMGALQTETIAHIFAMRNVLTPEQRRQFDDRIGEALTADAK